MRSLFPLLMVPVLIAASCSSSRKTARSVMLPDITISSAGSEYRASETMDWDITHTDVALRFNFAEKKATGHAELDMHPYFYSSDKIILDAKSMQIKDVLVNGMKQKLNYNNDSLTIYLDRKYHNKEQVKVSIDYIAQPYAAPTGGSKAIRDDRGLYFINTDRSVPNKPVQIWTQGETQANSHWVPTFDRPNERFTTRIHLTVPDSMTTLSNGQSGEAVFHEDGTRTDVWSMDKEIQPYVMMFAIGKFEIVADKQWNGKDVNYYVEPQFAPYALEMFKNTPEMIGFFSGVTGVPYPWNKYSQVVVRDYVSGAMENTSATLFGEFINQDKREMIDKDYEDVVSHELFHQWFGDYVTAESWSNLTLNESFATYGEQLWRRYKYGEASQQKLGYDDFMSYLNQADKNDAPLARFHYNEREDMFDRISYQKGASILHYLHGLAGDSAFYRAMDIYLHSNALQPAEVHNWRMAVEKATGKDWNWFFDQWYFRGGHPVIDVNYVFDDKARNVKITLVQKQDQMYRLPFKINVVNGKQVFSDMIDMDVRTMTVSYPYHDSTRPAVYIDADHLLVGKINDDKATDHWVRCYYNARPEDYRAKIASLKACSNSLGTASVQDMYKKAVMDNLEYVRVFVMNVLQQQKTDKVQNMFRSDVQMLAVQDMSCHVRAAAFDVLAKWKVSAAEDDIYVGLADISYKVEAAALGALAVVDKDTVYSVAKKMLAQYPKAALLNKVWDIIGEKGNTEDTVLINEWHYRFAGNNKISYSGSLAKYMKNTPSDDAFAKVLAEVENYITTENIGVYRASIASYIFDVAYFFKDEVAATNTKNSATKANRRLNMLHKTLLHLQETETDEDNIFVYKKYIADVWGE
ncbi:MAG: M1 family metallopeptidase [Chitinophagaceae bacterium]|nr:M1 family metallopeptidase [Chitinophagaceae bacterium]